MLIGVLETGDVAAHMRDEHGDSFTQIFEKLLQGRGLELAPWRAYEGELPRDPAEADGWLITGSRHGVYDDLPWIAPLEKFVREIYAARVPLVGICFGHQLMAQALGGRVEKSSKGWGIGPQTYDSVETGGKITVLASHQDQVVETPENTEIIASSPFCEYAGLAYRGAPAISYQPHPEFSRAFSSQIITARRGVVYPESLADEALARMADDLDSQWMAGRIAEFFHEHRAKTP